MSDYFILVRAGQTPEEYFQEALQVQDGVPFPVQPYVELERNFKFLRDRLKCDPTEISSEFFRMFHRRTGYFSIHRRRAKKDGTKYMSGYAVAIDQAEEAIAYLEEEFPEELTDNAYFTLNSYYRTLGASYSKVNLRRAARQERNISWLNTCYVDIDVGREEIGKDSSENLRWEQGLLQALILEERGIIPPVSIYARSGRGLYLFWLLEPVKYHFSQEHIIRNFKTCNQALLRIIRGEFDLLFDGVRKSDIKHSLLPGDLNAKDAARILRIHGSRHPKSMSKASYYPACLEEVFPERIYPLEKLMHLLGVVPDEERQEASAAPVLKRAAKPSTVPARARGVITANNRRVSDLVKIFEAGLVYKGRRYTALRYAATFARFARLRSREATVLLRHLADCCKPPYPSTDEDNDIPVGKIIDAVYGETGKTPFLFKNSILAKVLNIDRKTAEALDLQVICPENMPKLEKISAKASEMQLRREALQNLEPEKHSYPELLSMLNDQGHHISETTLRADLKILQEQGFLSRENMKGGRPRKKKRH